MTELQSPDIRAVWMGLGLLISLSGPFGSYETQSLWFRMAFWFLILGVSFVGFQILRFFFQRGIPADLGILGSALVAGLFAIVALPFLAMGFTDVFGAQFSTTLGLLEIAVMVFVIALGTCFFRLPAAAAPDAAKPTEGPVVAVAPEPAASGLLNRLAPEMRGPIRALKVRDHYVEVETDKGRTPVLMRLADAILEVAPGQGTQVHRSHWVAWSAIDAVEVTGTRAVLRLQGGALIPVSRANLPKLQARGLIQLRPERNA